MKLFQKVIESFVPVFILGIFAFYMDWFLIDNYVLHSTIFYGFLCSFSVLYHRTLNKLLDAIISTSTVGIVLYILSLIYQGVYQ